MDFDKITFPSAKLSTKMIDGEKYVWDPLRKSYLKLTPEEFVRRLTINYLITECNVEPQSISQEYPVSINGTAQRADIVVIGRDLRPVILVECKAPDVKITQEVFSQALRYNSVLGARYIILTNGVKHYSFEIIDATAHQMKNFPRMEY